MRVFCGINGMLKTQAGRKQALNSSAKELNQNAKEWESLERDEHVCEWSVWDQKGSFLRRLLSDQELQTCSAMIKTWQHEAGSPVPTRPLSHDQQNTLHFKTLLRLESLGSSHGARLLVFLNIILKLMNRLTHSPYFELWKKKKDIFFQALRE